MHKMKEIVFTPKKPGYYPTKEWRNSSPEAQGMSSIKLLDMIAHYKEAQQKNEHLLIDSITVIRNEHIIADLYFNPLFPKDEKHIINSCTKSIISILIGIAIDKGMIKNVDVAVLDFFDDINIKCVDERLKNLTVKNLLAMRTGWHSRDSYLYKWEGLFKMQTTDNWVEYILNLPFEVNPNTRFDYSNMASFLLSAIIKKAVGTDTFSFAKKYLFSPLGITDILWDESPKGIHIGFARMWLKPHDMAKIGLLFLQKGKWENQQIVSEAWVETSISAHSFPKQYKYIYKENNKINFGASGGNWVFSNLFRPLTDGYGYQWWLDKSGMFSAFGVGGQFIMVVPKENLVVVVTSKLKSRHTFFPVQLLNKYIIPSIISNSPLPENEMAYNKIVAYSNAPEINLLAQTKTNLPIIAHKVSDKVFSINQNVGLNPGLYNNMKFVFDEELDYAVFSYCMRKEKVNYKIGLNNRYRMTNTNGKSYAALGAWTSPNTFTISYELIGYSAKGKWILTFVDDKIKVKEIGMTGEYNYEGKLQN